MEKLINDLNINDLLNDTDDKSVISSLTNTSATTQSSLPTQTIIVSNHAQNGNTNTNSNVVDILLQEINTPSKTPVSVLQEICSKCRLDAPVYELVSTGGNAHEPVFNLKASIGELVVTSQGNSKKRAKQAAALNMISLLNQLGTTHTNSSASTETAAPAANSSVHQQIEKIK